MIANILYIIIAFFSALGITSWLYYFNRKSSQKVSLLLFLLRFIAVFSVVLLLFNPIWKRNIINIQKPKLLIAADNSSSIKNLKQDNKAKEIIKAFQNNTTLSEKFQTEYVSFGASLQTIDSLNFKDDETDINQLLQYAKPVKNHQSNTIVLLTDGNQTKGSDMAYYNGKNQIFPIVLGDTIHFEDVFISQINVNDYAFLDNTFPVEIFTNYLGKKNAQSLLTVNENGVKVFQKTLHFSPNQNFESVQFTLPAQKVGTHYYTVSLSALGNEKNTRNNRSDFSIEVVNQQAKVLIASSFSHPDLGALKQSIELNKQRSVDIKVGNFSALKLNEYQSVILYQPNPEFTSLFTLLQQINKGYFIITGTKTDWNFLNAVQKDFSKINPKLKEQYRPVYNTNYPNFVLDDFGITELPPLQDVFGAVNFQVPYETLFYAQVGNTTLDYPLLATYTKNERNYMVLFGEGLWQWQLWSNKEKQSFLPFSLFINNLIQYSANNDTKNQIHLEYEKLLYSNQQQRIKAQFFDQNFKTDNRVSLTLYLTDLQTKKNSQLPFAQINDYYEVILSNLKSGNYTFQVKAEGKNQQQSGFFKVLDYNIEDQFVSANFDKLNSLAQNTNGQIVLAKDYQKIIDHLIQVKTTNIQKTTKKISPLIHWKWLLLIIIVSLSVEWFIRKYRGLV